MPNKRSINYWDKIADYYEWEFDLICSRQKEDVKFWLKQTKKYGDPVLELACGAGRITIPIAEEGYDITALDSSASMLAKLKKRTFHLPNLKISKQLMQSFKFADPFRFCFISYSSFQQLLTLEDQMTCLKNIHRHLHIDGKLGLDIGTCICEGPDSLPFTHLYTEYNQQHKEKISMFTSFKTDRLNQIKHWKDRYLIESSSGDKKEIINQLSLKECSRDYMELLLPACGFKIVEIWGSFREGLPNQDSHNLLILAEKV